MIFIIINERQISNFYNPRAYNTSSTSNWSERNFHMMILLQYKLLGDKLMTTPTITTSSLLNAPLEFRLTSDRFQYPKSRQDAHKLTPG